jgi:hypothetical protein
MNSSSGDFTWRETKRDLSLKLSDIISLRTRSNCPLEVLRALCLFLLLLIIPISSHAQCSDDSKACVQSVPRFVKISGAIRKPETFLVSGTVAVRFIMYSQETGGSPLWQEVQNVKLDSQGRYETALGTNTTDGVPITLFASGEPRWLGVQILAPGFEEEPRTLMVSVPYALQAENAQTLGGLPPSAFVKAGSSAPVASYANVAVRPTSLPVLTSGLVPTPMPKSSSSQDITVAGATVNAVPKFSSASSLTDSQITDQNGVVTLQNLANILFADQFAGGVAAAVSACPTNGCVIYALSPSVDLNLGTIDPGSKVITIYLGPYTYTVNQITLRGGLKIIGMGGTQTILQSVNGNNPVFVLPQANYVRATNVTLSGFHLKGSAGNTSEDGFFLDTSSTFSSGLWYSTFNDIYMDGFAGIALHIKGPANSFAALTQWVLFNNVIAFRAPGGGNALRLEGGVFELRFVNCQFDGNAIGDGVNIYIGGLGTGIGGYPWSITFEGLVSQTAATAVQIDGALNLSFHESHHELLWGGYQINFTHNIPTLGLTISDSSFSGNVGTNNGSGYVLNVATTRASQINFTHNQILGTPDSIVKSTNLASVVYQDNGSGGTTVPVTSGITTQLIPAGTVDIQGVHTVGMNSSTTAITTIQSSLGPGETITFFALQGPFTFASGGNINLMGASSVTVNGSITFVRNDLIQGLQWTPVSQWSPMR